MYLTVSSSFLISFVIGGVGPWNSRDFWAPNGTRLWARCHFTGPKKLLNLMAQPLPTCPRYGYARIQNIMHGAVYTIVKSRFVYV